MKYLKYLKESQNNSLEIEISDAFIDLIDDGIAFIDEVSDDLCSILIKISKIHYEWDESLENNKNGYETTRKIKNILNTLNIKHSLRMFANTKVATNDINNKKLKNYNFLEIKFIKSLDSQNKLIISNKGDEIYINNDFLVEKLKSFGLELILHEEDDGGYLSYYSNIIGFSIDKDKELTKKQKIDITNLFINDKIEINFRESIYAEHKYLTLNLSSSLLGHIIYPILV